MSTTQSTGSGTAGAAPPALHRPLLIAGGSWLGLGVLVVFQLWLATYLWLLVLLVDAIVALGVLAGAGIAVAGLARARRPVLATLVGLVTVALLASAIGLDWRPVYAYGWFGLHRAGFSAVADLARTDSLDQVPSTGTEDLPGALGWLSVDGEVSWCGRSRGERVLLLPALEWAPDGGSGFVHVIGPDPDSAPDWECDANGDQVRPRYQLGGGWWWAD